MAVQIDSPTLGRGNDWNSFYETEPLQGNNPFSPSAFGTLLFSQPDAASALDLLGGMPGGSLTFADIGGTIAIDQLPPGSLVTVDSIGEDGLYFFDDSSGLPSLINPDSTVSFISQHIGFSDLSGTISIDQFPPGTVVSVDSINEDAVYFFDNTLGLPKLINATDLSDFVGLSNLTFADIGGTVGLDQFPPGSVAALDSIDEDALYFFDNTLFAPKLINAADTLTFLGITGGGGSFLANNTARVDPSGNDSTGTIGDLGKPFLTVQAAITAFESTTFDNRFLIDIGNNSFAEDLITSLTKIAFVGAAYSQNNAAFNTVTFTSSGSSLKMLHCSGGNISFAGGISNIFLDNAVVGNVTKSVSGDCSIGADVGTGQIGDITIATGGEDLYCYGLTLAGTVSAPDHPIHVEKCLPLDTNGDGSYAGCVIIDSVGSEVFATGSLLQSVSAAGTLHLADSRVIGTNNATSTIYTDVLLLPRYQMSVDFDATAGLKLLNDSATPGNSKYYGTDSGGTKGYFALPSGESGDVVGPSSSVDSEVALFNSTTGKLIKRATGSGLAVLTSGVLSTTTNNSSNWDTAFTERHQWDGGTTNLVAATGRTSLGLGTLATQSGTFSGTSSGTNTGDQTITLTGDVTGSGAGSFAATIGTGKVTDAKMAALVKPAVAVVADANLTLSGEQTIDGVTTVTSLVLATAQSTASQNGPWISASGAWTRPTWYSAGSTTQAPQFLTTFIRLGTTYQGSTWRMTTASVTIDTTSTTWVQTPMVLRSSSVSGTLPGAVFPALTGDVTTSAGSLITVLGNIPTAVTAAGYLLHTNIAAPSTPASGKDSVWTDSTDKRFHDINDAGTIGTTVVKDTGASHNFLTAISASGVISKAQPADSDISFTDITTGNASASQHGFLQKLPGGTTSFLRADGTFAAPAGGATVGSTLAPLKGDNAGNAVALTTQTVGDTAATISADTDVVYLNTLFTANRILTLPAASGYPIVKRLNIVIGAAGVGNNSLSIARAGSDTINGGSGNVTLIPAFANNTGINQRFTLQSDGSAAWIVLGSNTTGNMLVGGTLQTTSNVIIGTSNNTANLTFKGGPVIDGTVNSSTLRLMNNGATQGALAIIGRPVTAKTSNYTVLALDSNTMFTNTGAAGEVDFTLPTAVVGQTYTFYVATAQILKIVAGASTTISMSGTTSGTAGNVASSTVGNSVTLVAISTTSWVAIAQIGTVAVTWTVT